MGFIKLVQSGNYVELYQYENNLNVLSRQKKRFGRCGNKRFASLRFRREDNVRRLVKHFQRLIWSNLATKGSPTFFTLTMFQVVSMAESYTAFNGFVRRMRKVFGQDFKYITVPEFHKKHDRIHFHMLIWGLNNDLIKNERYNRSFQNLWGRGFVDCISTDGNIKLAGYFAKYMRKAMSDDRLCGKKAFVCSRNVLRPVSSSFVSSLTFLEEIVGVDNLPIVKKIYDVQWLGKCIYSLYDTSLKF